MDIHANKRLKPLYLTLASIYCCLSSGYAISAEGYTYAAINPLIEPLYYAASLIVIVACLVAIYMSLRGDEVSLWFFVTSAALLTCPEMLETMTRIFYSGNLAKEDIAVSDTSNLIHNIAWAAFFVTGFILLVTNGLFLCINHYSEESTNAKLNSQRPAESPKSLTEVSNGSSKVEASVASNISMAKHSVSDGLSERAPVPGKRKLSID